MSQPRNQIYAFLREVVPTGAMSGLMARWPGYTGGTGEGRADVPRDCGQLYDQAQDPVAIDLRTAPPPETEHAAGYLAPLR